jgi:hypothetical protein
MLCQEVYGLQQHVLHLYCLSARACAAPGRVFLVFSRTFVLHLACLSTRALRCTWMCLPTGALCCTWTCLSARIFAAPVRICLQELCDAPGRVCQQECSPGCNCRCSVANLFDLFRFVSKQFCLFRLFLYRFETPKQTEIFWFFVSRNKPKQTRNRSCFGLFRFEPKFIFVCFEDTLVTT